MLAGVDPLAVSPGARVELLVQLERHAAWVESLRLSVVAAVAGPGPDYSVEDAQLVDVADPLWDVQMVQDSIRDELAAALHISGRTAQRRIDLARDLEHKLPRTRDLLRAGLCTFAQAAVVAQECGSLSVGQARLVEKRALVNTERQTPNRTRRALRRAIASICPRRPEALVEEEFARRDVSLVHDGGVMATVVATLPAPDAIAVWNALTAAAHQDTHAGDVRSRAHKRADALVGWAHQAGQDPQMPVMQGKKRLDTQVVIDAATLFGLADHPGEIIGYGPIPAELARLLAADSKGWRRLVTDPVTGYLLDYGHRTYTPPAALREYVLARDRRCQFPGCEQPSYRCDLDHVEPFTGTPEGGSTSADNLLTVCRRHHQLKTHHRWRVRVHHPNNPEDPDHSDGPDDSDDSEDAAVAGRAWSRPTWIAVLMARSTARLVTRTPMTRR